MMLTCFGRLACCVLSLALALILVSRAAAVAPVIRDDAKFFSPEVVKKANEDIREIYRKYDRDVLVESFMTVPDQHKDKVKAMSSEERSKFFQSWGEERTKATAAKGVYILVCKEPAHVRVVVTPGARAVFDRAAQEQLSKALLNNFREKQFDGGLTAAIKFIREKLAASSK
jgi:uncharacterized membrane protein YgcG